MLMGIKGNHNVRFQPYRLANSSCYDGTDARIGCVTCHDPHRDPLRGASHYDAKCLACHRSAGVETAAKTQRFCPVSKENCSGCHMPEIEIPGAHYKFTDHWIRVVRPGDPYPD
jgi:hypothetical protein